MSTVLTSLCKWVLESGAPTSLIPLKDSFSRFAKGAFAVSFPAKDKSCLSHVVMEQYFIDKLPNRPHTYLKAVCVKLRSCLLQQLQAICKEGLSFFESNTMQKYPVMPPVTPK